MIEKSPEIIKLLEKKGWALYHMPYVPKSSKDWEFIISKGRAREKMIQFEPYMLLPLIDDDSDTEKVLNEIDICFYKGRLPWFVYFKNNKPKYILCVDSIGIGYDSLLIMFDVNTTIQFKDLFGFPDPLSINEPDLIFEAFTLTYETLEIEDLNNIVKCKGRSLIPEPVTKKDIKDWLEMVSFKSFNTSII